MLAARIEPVPYDAVPASEWQYVMTEEACQALAVAGVVAVGGTWIEERGGRKIAHLRYTHTKTTAEVPLDVPLCCGCDEPVDHACCNNCHLVFTDGELVQ